MIWRTELRVVISCNASVVDKEMDTVGLLGGKIFRELNSTFLRGDIAGKSVQATRTSIVCLDRTLEHLLPSASNVNLGSVCHERLSDHQSNACTSTSDNSRDVRDIEEGARLELVVGTLGYRLSAVYSNALGKEPAHM